MRTKVVFNGYELTQRFLVSELKSPLLSRALATADVTGRDGSIFLGATLAPREIGMRLTVRESSLRERQAAARELASLLSAPEPAKLWLSIDGGIYYIAIPNAPSNGDRYGNATSYDVSFIAHDPVAYGTKRTLTVQSGSSLTFHVDGTYKTAPIIRAPEAANANDGYWRLTLDGEDALIASVPSGAQTASIYADCCQRVLRIAQNVALLRTDACWLELEPGTHTLTMQGSGDATVEYVERWL